MNETLFFILLVMIVLIFLLAVPALLYAGLKKIADPVPLWLPLLLSGIVLLVLAGSLQFRVINNSDVLLETLEMAILMLLVITLAVISPFPPFEKKIRIDPPIAIFPLLSLVGVYLLFLASLGESLEGGPLSWFSPLLPLTGWILDGAAASLHIQDIVYAPGLQMHTILLATGLYLEVFIIAGLFYALLSVLPRAKDEIQGK
ncbi:MAG: hypothetical protein WC626_03320 [Methanoregula sp.]